MSQSVVYRSVTPRRQAGWILEATGAAVCWSLLVWLLLWFVLFRAGQPQIHALFVRAHDLGVLFQERDARAIEQDQADREKLTPSSLKAALENLAGRSAAPTLIYISAPAIGVGPSARIQGSVEDSQEGPTLLELIEAVANRARGDVLLAIDAAQVGSDRQRAIYANSPYHGLERAVRELKPQHKLAVLLSCQPDEVSLIHNGEGQSLFAAALKYALTESQGPSIRIHDLADRVRNLVGNSAIELGSSQTPQLIAVGAPVPGQDPNDNPAFQFRIGRPRTRTTTQTGPAKNQPAPANTTPEQPTAATTTTPAPASAPAPAPAPASGDAASKLREDMIAEWTRYDHLYEERAQVVPELVAPLELRQYEAALEQAVLLVRQALRDQLPASIKLANDALKDLAIPRDHLAQIIREYRPNQGRVPFQPIDDAQWAQVDAILASLAKPDDPASAKGPSEGQSDELRKEIETARREADSAGYYPATHLELQLPLWAMTYTRDFADFAGARARDVFTGNSNAARLLREATLARKDAERALNAVEFGGLDWIQSEIQDGDRIRREVQDQIFDPGLNPPDRGAGTLFRNLNERIADYRARYESAHDLARVEREARIELSRALYDIPALGDRKIHEDRNRPRDRDDGPLPREVDDTIQAAQALLRALEAKPTDKDGTAGISSRKSQLHNLRASLKEKRDALEKSIEKIDIEELLRTRLPWIHTTQRKKLLDDWETNHPLGRWIARESPIESRNRDRTASAFWVEAIGLAALDTTLRERFAGKAAADETETAQKDAGNLAAIWSRIGSSGDPQAEMDRRLEVLDAVGDHASQTADRLRRHPNNPAATTTSTADRSRTPAIWQVSFRRALEVENLAPRTWTDSDPFWKALLQFQAERLRDDYVPKVNLASLGGPPIEPLPNPFPPRLGGDLTESSSIVATDTPEFRVDFRLPRPVPTGRKAILSVQLTEEPRSDKPSFTLKDRAAGDAEGPSHLVAIGPRDEADARNLARSFRLGRTGDGTGTVKTTGLVVECRTFFAGLVSGEGEDGRRAITIRKPQGPMFRIALAPNEDYLRRIRHYSDNEVRQIKTHYREQNRTNERFAWYGQPFYYTVEIEKIHRDAPRRVWVSTVLRTSKEPKDQELKINRKAGPQPFDIRRDDAPERIETADFIRAEDIPGVGEKGDTTLEIRLFDQPDATSPILAEAFEIRSVRMTDCLSFSDSFRRAERNIKHNVQGTNYDQLYMLSVCRNKPSKNLVSEPINGDELGVTLHKFSTTNNRDEQYPFAVEGRTDKLWPSRGRDECIDFKYGLYINDRPVGYTIDYLGYDGAETSKDKSLQKLHPHGK